MHYRSTSTAVALSVVAFVAAACGDDAVGATGSDPAPTEVTTGADDGGTTGGAASDTGADEGSTTGGVVASTGTPDDDSSGGADDTASSTGAEVPCPDVPYSVIAGTEPGAAAGRTVAFVGDMDGDGIEDFAVAEPAADHGGAVNSGRVYVVAGQSDAYLDFGLADVGGTRPGWVIEGEGPDHAAGTAVYGAQDVNGDGAADLLVGSPGASAGGRWSVVFGGLAADAGAIALHDIRMGSGGFAVDVAPDSSTILPGGGAGVGDFNDDGFADVLVGAPAVENLLGPSFADIIFGRDDGIDVLVLDGEPLPAADGVSYTRQGLSVGLRVAGGGDFDGDGIPDAVFSGPGELSYLARGGATVSSSTVEQLAASDAGLQIDASLDPLSYLSAGSLVVLGDVNDDGRADLGVPLRKNAFQETGDPSGIAVVFGTDTMADIALAEAIAGSGGFASTRGDDQEQDGEGAELGRVVGPAGDVDDDGVDDFFITSTVATAQGARGRVYVVYGAAGLDAVDLGTLVEDGAGMVVDAPEIGDGFGGSVAAGRDVSGDGIPDVLVGADGGGVTGTAYLFYGRGEDCSPVQ